MPLAVNLRTRPLGNVHRSHAEERDDEEGREEPRSGCPCYFYCGETANRSISHNVLPSKVLIAVFSNDLRCNYQPERREG